MAHVTVSRVLTYRVYRHPFTALTTCLCCTLDDMSEIGPSSPNGVAESPLTVLLSRTPTPEPLNRVLERSFWVELRHATANERNYGDFHLNLCKIVAEYTEGSAEF